MSDFYDENLDPEFYDANGNLLPECYMDDLRAQLPRIPPQYRPSVVELPKYHVLWEADWKEIPRDPYLLRRIGKDAWVVCAAWDLTDVEMSVMRAHNA